MRIFSNKNLFPGTPVVAFVKTTNLLHKIASYRQRDKTEAHRILRHVQKGMVYVQ